jgi:glyoxylase-like metal-dependent hydrolase (beta-lactamase superfamily II)/ferredoxin
MARLERRLAENVGGAFFVDDSCIDCATCREMQPSVFAPGPGFSFVHRQPEGEAEEHRALMALVACPTASIGTAETRDARAASASFPEPVDGNVSFCGFTSDRSFGAWSYLIERPEGNVLVDSPRAAGPLLSRIAARGGVSRMFLTHRDDVADHEAFRKRFSCERIIHHADASALPGAERILDGPDPVALAPDLLALPVPGHTRGSSVLLYDRKYLFTGDHLAFSKRRGHLVGFRDACWYSWDEQIRSMERLLDFSFAWVLPGHGERFNAESPEAMREEVEKCVRWMKGR